MRPAAHDGAAHDGAAPDGRLYVVVGIVKDDRGRVLIQQRRPGTPKAGKWEFPGGKLEPGETPQQALGRELREELGITVRGSAPLKVICHDYDHARVWLDIYLVNRYDGVASGREGQRVEWTDIDTVQSFDILEAVPPIIDALQHAG